MKTSTVKMQEIEPSREISQQISSINTGIEYLFDELRILEKRLEPIIMPPIGEEASSEGVDEPFVPRSQVASQLETISTKLVQLRQRVAYLHQYVEI